MTVTLSSLQYFWNTLVLPRLGNASHVADSYAWGGSFSSADVNQGTDCSGAVSAELSALVRGANMVYARQFWTGTFAGVNPGDTGPVAGISDTDALVCIDAPASCPANAAMLIAIIQTGSDPAQAANAHMICRVPSLTSVGSDILQTGVDIEMGGQSDNYHSSQTDPTCASVMDTTEFDQWFYLPGPIVDDTNFPTSTPTTTTGATTPVSAPVTTLFYPDVANVNWDNSGTGVVSTQGQQNLLSFLAMLAPQGFSGCAHKMTQGAGFVDWYGALAQTWCAQNNLPFIGYHYLTTEDPNAQAQNWLAAGGGTNAMFDWEESGGDLNNFWNVVNAFNAVGVNVQLAYIPQWYLEGDGSGAGTDISALAPNGILLVSSAWPGGSGYASDIYANAGGDTGEGFNPFDNGPVPSAWQFTNQASIGSFVVDCNAYLGTDINALFGTTAPVATPTPPVAPPAVVPPPAPPVTPVVTPTPPATTTPPPTPPPVVTPPPAPTTSTSGTTTTTTVTTSPVVPQPTNLAGWLEKVLTAATGKSAQQALQSLESDLESELTKEMQAVLPRVIGKVSGSMATPEVPTVEDFIHADARSRAFRSLLSGLVVAVLTGLVTVSGQLAGVNWFDKNGLVAAASIAGASIVTSVSAYIGRLVKEPASTQPLVNQLPSKTSSG